MVSGVAIMATICDIGSAELRVVLENALKIEMILGKIDQTNSSIASQHVLSNNRADIVVFCYYNIFHDH